MGMRFNPFTGALDYVGDPAIPATGDAERLIVTAMAGENISGDRVVFRDNDGLMRYADSSNLDHLPRPLRLSLTAVAVGDEGEFLTIGEHSAAGWNWTVGELLYLGPNGFMSPIAPDSGFIIQVANVIDSDSVYFDPKIPIQLP